MRTSLPAGVRRQRTTDPEDDREPTTPAAPLTALAPAEEHGSGPDALRSRRICSPRASSARSRRSLSSGRMSRPRALARVMAPIGVDDGAVEGDGRRIDGGEVGAAQVGTRKPRAVQPGAREVHAPFPRAASARISSRCPLSRNDTFSTSAWAARSAAASSAPRGQARSPRRGRAPPARAPPAHGGARRPRAPRVPAGARAR